jgi:uncharacterized protein (TIGR02145 family)
MSIKTGTAFWVGIKVLLWTLFITGLMAQSAPDVTNVSFAQRTDGSGIVDITYDVSDADGDVLTISLLVSDDGGSTYTFVATQTSGDIGYHITPGTGKTIVWNFGAEHPNTTNNQIVVKITADDAYITDIDGNYYSTIVIGTQVWMAENLKVTKYRDGTAIPTGYSNSDWQGLSTGGYAVYGDDEDNVDTYGYLYNWYATTNSRNIAPEGWHVPTDAEWTTLIDYLGGSSVAGGKMKDNINWNGTNESGFTALPGGYRDSNGGYIYGGYNSYFWSSTEYSSNSARYRGLDYNSSRADRNGNNEKYGFSVRCVRD